jgi:hypothetical protein
MSNSLRYSIVSTETQMKEVAEFASSFNHDLSKAIHPIYMVHRGGSLIGYFCLPNIPVFFPAFHPDKCSPRDFVGIVEQVRAAACLNSIGGQFPNGQCWLAVENQPAIPRQIIERLGFKNTNCQLYQYY